MNKKGTISCRSTINALECSASELLMWHNNAALDIHTAVEWSEKPDHSCVH